MQNNIPTLYISKLDSSVFKNSKFQLFMPFLPKNLKNINSVAMVNTTAQREQSEPAFSQRLKSIYSFIYGSVLIKFEILHVDTMFGYKGEGLLQACTLALIFIPYGH